MAAGNDIILAEQIKQGLLYGIGNLRPVEQIVDYLTLALAMLRKLKSYKMLTGYRGSKPLDVQALADTMVKISQYAAQNKDQLVNENTWLPDARRTFG